MAYAPTYYPPQPQKRGIPGWVLVGSYVLVLAGSALVLPFMLLMAAFGCDSGTAGCDTAGFAAMGVYAVIGVLGATAMLVVGLMVKTTTTRGRGWRVASLVMIYCLPIVGFAVSFVFYFVVMALLTAPG